MNTAHASTLSGIAAVLLCLAGNAPVGAQPPVPPEPDQALIRPPRLIESPGSARLAPPPQDGARVLEEVIVVNESEWRLPDLGSEWRREQESLPPEGRIQVSFFPLFDPESPDPFATIYPGDKEMGRTGFIEVFRIRFGGRSDD